MAMTGFFTRVEVKAKAITRKEQGLSVERLHQLGIKGVERMNPHAKTKHMEPSGSKHPEVYILGEAPSEADDNEGEPFVGASGKYLRQYLPDDVKIRINNCVRTLPIRRAKGSRKPTTHEIECYRKSTELDIVQTKPRIVLALGDTATQWCLGHEVGQISCCRGRRFPTEIAGHKLWVYSAHHPAYILRQLDNEEYEQIPGEEHARYFQKDVVRVFDDLDSLPDPPVEDLTKLYDGTRIELTDAQKIVNFLHKAAEDEGVCGIDVETNRERPYSTGARILSLSVSASFGALAFPVDHPGAKWSKSDYWKIDQAIRHFLKSPVKKVAHNTPFDLEWLIWKYGKEVAFTCFWHDSMSQAFVLDERKGGMGLNFLNILHFGLKLKKQSVGRAESVWFGMGVETSGEIDRVKLEQTNVEDVCKYNGLDSKYCRKLYYVQKGLLQDRGLWEPYREFVKRVPSITTAQEHGIPVDHKVVIEFQKKEGDFLKSIRQQIANLEVVRKYNKRYGEYDPNSHPHNIKMFSELLGYEEVRLKGGRFSTKEEILSKLDEPLAKLIVELRGHQKLKGTYIDRMRPDHEKPLVFPDGKIHCRFNHTRTDTGRLSSSEPNCFPGEVEVLTKRGWTKFNRIRRGDEIAQYDLKSKSIDFAKPLAYIKQKADGLVRIKTNKQIDVVCTRNHNFYLNNRHTRKWSKFSASNYPNDYEQPQAGLFVGGTKSLSVDQIIILAALQADAWIKKDGHGIEWSFSKERKIKRLLNALDNLGIKYKKSPKPCTDGKDKTRIRIPKAEVPEWTKNKKFFGKWILELDQPSFQALAEEIWFWDGYFSGRTMYSSSVKSNADWAQILTCLSGRRAKIRVYAAKSGNPNWQVDATNQPYSLTTGRKKEDVEYSGQVYCVTMPKGTLVIRYNGKVCITGNSQNWPKREDKWIRGQIAAPPGMIMLCCDQGQLEFRVIGMASKDKVIVDSLFGGYDVHMAWAIKIAKVYPKVVRDRHGSLNEKAMKAFRGELKTDVIFPWFYGASLYLAAGALDHMPSKILEPIKEEFDQTYAGVVAFQEEQQEFYHKHGYTEALTGHRRHGPMSKNQLINAPIQGAASDIVCWSWNELNRIAYKTERPWLAPCLNVHDDLSFFIPKKHLDESVEIITRIMCLVPFDFINVPLVVEASVGPNWYKQEEIGQFRSDQLDERMTHYFSEAAT